MKNRHCYILLICIVYMFTSQDACAVNNSDKTRLIELKNRLKEKISQSEKIATLYKISRFYREEPAERDYCKMLYYEAAKVDSIEKQEYAIYNLVRYYYNQSIRDSVNIWNNKMEDIAKKTKRHSDYYFKSSNMYCQFNLWYNPDEGMANEALRLYHLANKENNQIGIYSSCETLGIAYCVMGQDSLAVQYYLEGISIVQKHTPFEYSNMHSLLELAIESYLSLKNTKEIEEYIIKYEKLTEEISRGKFETRKYPINRCRWLAHLFRAHLNILSNNLNQAYHHLSMGERYVSIENDIYCHYLQHLVNTYYYKATKNYNKASQEIEIVLTYENSTDLYLLKGDILMLDGKYKEAAECYRLSNIDNKENDKERFLKQMNQLSHLHDINLANEAHNEEVLKRERLQLFIVLCITFFTLILLVLSIIYMLHSRKMRRKLTHERDRLIKSEKELKEARNRAVESDRLKSLFLANMSHEIRTPLNAIVGFSHVLCEENEDINQENRKQFSNLILHNSDLLLNLINDILDLSKLEANMYNFKFEEYNIDDCCTDCIESVKYGVNKDIDISFVKHDSPLFLYTDKLRLHQVIMNLLTNAIKFTDKGSITLEYRADIDKGMVFFSVTDTGCGIPQDKHKVIFNRFEKLNNYVQGTGLGLSISELIIKQLGGKIWVDEQYKSGARFIFTHKI